MKKLFQALPLLFSLLFVMSCTKTESDFSESPSSAPESISLKANTVNTLINTAVTFLVTSSRNNADVTAQSKIYVNASLITGTDFTFTQTGTYAVYAEKGNLTTPVITINVTMPPTNSVNYKHKVLVEEYSGTWCGNCPRILYGVDLLHQQTNNAVSVGIHLFGGDPFITTDGNSLAAQQSVGGVPTGYINRRTGWSGPQYENVPQVINSIQASSFTGLAIKSEVAGGNVNLTVKVAYSQPLSSDAKLTVYLVEDKLYYTQRNYSSNLYGGAANIPNFEYNGVLRKVVSALSGDAIQSSGNNNEKQYSFGLPAGVNTANAKIVAFVTDAAGAVINVQDAKLGEDKLFEKL